MALPSALRDMAQLHIADQLSDVMETQMSTAFTYKYCIDIAACLVCTCWASLKTPGKGGLGYSSFGKSEFTWHAPQNHTNGVLWHTCNINIWEVEERGSEIQGHPRLHGDFKAAYSKAKQKTPGK